MLSISSSVAPRAGLIRGTDARGQSVSLVGALIAASSSRRGPTSSGLVVDWPGKLISAISRECLARPVRPRPAYVRACTRSLRLAGAGPSRKRSGATTRRSRVKVLGTESRAATSSQPPTRSGRATGPRHAAMPAKSKLAPTTRPMPTTRPTSAPSSCEPSRRTPTTATLSETTSAPALASRTVEGCARSGHRLISASRTHTMTARRSARYEAKSTDA